jgi:hypothetical protein
MNKLIIMGPIMALLALMVPNLAQAHTQDYNDGYSLGQSYAEQRLSIDTGFLNSHSKNWQAGFNDGWNSVPYGSGNTQQSQSSGVNIHGSHNTVTVNQGEVSQGNSDQGSSGGSGSTFRGDQPQCIILCSIIR